MIYFLILIVFKTKLLQFDSSPAFLLSFRRYIVTVYCFYLFAFDADLILSQSQLNTWNLSLRIYWNIWKESRIFMDCILL